MSRIQVQRRVLFGTYILIIGVLALLDNLNIFESRRLLEFWPTAFIAFGGLKLYQTRHPAGYAIGGALVLTGILMTLHRLGIIYFSWREWWPLILIVVGIVILLKDRFYPLRTTNEVGGESRNDPSLLNIISVMSGNKRKVDSQDFRGGEMTVIMGGADLDLRPASMESSATLHVFVVWGGISLRVPADWTIEMDGVPLLGGIEDRSVPPMNSTKRLIIKGYVLMGGMEIKN